jgi:hypothetical protein
VLSLYKVGTRGRVQLEGIATEGDFYTVEKEDDGTIVLSPVQVNTTSAKRTTEETPVVV